MKTDSTIVRIRGEMVVWRNSVYPSVADQVIWYAGIVVGHENLLGALPDPELDDADWMWYTTGYSVPELISNGSGGTLRAGPPRHIIIDNRAKRKLVNEEAKALFVFKNDVASDEDIDVGVAVRMLFLLH